MSTAPKMETLEALRAVLFTDVVDSTGLKQRLGEREALDLLGQYRACLRETLAGFPGGREVDTQGDSVLVVFPTASEAVRFALQWRRVWGGERIPGGGEVVDRVGIHLGEVRLMEGHPGHKPSDVGGLAVDTAARLVGLARGGQTLVSRPVYDSAGAALSGNGPGAAGVRWECHGSYPLRGLEAAVEIWQVGEEPGTRFEAPAGARGTGAWLAERWELGPVRGGPFGWGGWLVNLPTGEPGDRFFRPAAGPANPDWQEVTGTPSWKVDNDRPVPVCRLCCGSWQRLTLFLPAVARDASGQRWDVQLRPEIRIADPPAFFRSAWRTALESTGSLRLDQAADWLRERLRPALGDWVASLGWEPCRDRSATPVAVWEAKLREWLRDFGLESALALAPEWSSEDARRRQLAEDVERWRQEKEEAEARVRAARQKAEEKRRALEENERIRENQENCLRHQESLQAMERAQALESLQRSHEADRRAQQTAVAEAEAELDRVKAGAVEAEARHRLALADLAVREQEIIRRGQHQARADELAGIRHAEQKLTERRRAALDAQVEEAQKKRELARIQAEQAELEARRQRSERESRQEEEAAEEAREEKRRERARASEEERRAREVLEEELRKAADARKKIEELLKRIQDEAETQKGTIKDLAASMGTITGGMAQVGVLVEILKLIREGRVPPAQGWFEADAAGVQGPLVQLMKASGQQPDGLPATALFAEDWLRRGREAGNLFNLRCRRAVQRQTRSILPNTVPHQPSFPTRGLAIGSPIELLLTAPRDGYLTLINPGTSGDFYLLTPNDEALDLRAAAGRTLSSAELMPRREFRQHGPEGQEYLVAFVTPTPLFSRAELEVDSADGLSRECPYLSRRDGRPVSVQPLRHVAAARVKAMERQLEGLPAGSWSVGFLRYLVVEA